MCIYICIYVNMDIYIHIHSFPHTYIHKHKHMYMGIQHYTFSLLPDLYIYARVGGGGSFRKEPTLI